jgi:hypothetical protein
MTARQDRQLVRNPKSLKLADKILGEINRKCQVVTRVKQQRLSIPHPIEVPARADQRPKNIELDRSVQALPDVPR